jgi:hypothetical protein
MVYVISWQWSSGVHSLAQEYLAWIYYHEVVSVPRRCFDGVVVVISSAVALEGTEEFLLEGPRVVQGRDRSVDNHHWHRGPAWEIRIEGRELGDSNNTSTLTFIGDCNSHVKACKLECHLKEVENNLSELNVPISDSYASHLTSKNRMLDQLDIQECKLYQTLRSPCQACLFLRVHNRPELSGVLVENRWRNVHEIWHFRIVRKIAELCYFSFRPDKFGSGFTWRHSHISMFISLNTKM